MLPLPPNPSKAPRHRSRASPTRRWYGFLLTGSRRVGDTDLARVQPGGRKNRSHGREPVVENAQIITSPLQRATESQSCNRPHRLRVRRYAPNSFTTSSAGLASCRQHPCMSNTVPPKPRALRSSQMAIRPPSRDTEISTDGQRWGEAPAEPIPNFATGSAGASPHQEFSAASALHRLSFSRLLLSSGLISPCRRLRCAPALLPPTPAG